MRIVTSVGPSRIERQQHCIRSWLNMGCEVTAVQSQGETEYFKPLFDGVTFVETDLVGNLFGKPKLVRTAALLNQAVDSNILILNSDIEIRTSKENFFSKWSEPEAKELKLGIRWEEDPTTGKLIILEWGIDAFLITPRMTELLGDVGLTIGCPAWDYWIPIVLHNRYGYKVTTLKDPELIHLTHERNWSERDYNIGVKILTKACGLDRKESSLFIKKLTGRENVNKRVRKNLVRRP